MITRRVRQHACFALFRVEMRNRVVGAAKLERAHALKVFALEEYRRARAFIERARRQNGGTVGDAFKTRGGVEYVIEGGGGKHLHRQNSPEAVAKQPFSQLRRCFGMPR
jgi:hypothetical protein